MTPAHIRAAIETTATSFGLDPNVVEAVVVTESGGNPWAYRPEPTYRYLVNVKTRHPFRRLSLEEQHSNTAPADFPTLAGSPDQEWQAQRASWGLMQVMGAVAREQGCRAPFLTVLCDVVTGLEFGCKVLAGHLRWSANDLHRALRAYNGGRGGADLPQTAAYAEKVLGHLQTIRGVR